MRLILSRAKGQDLSKQFRIERSVSDVNAVILFRFNTADIRPLRDRRFAKCTIRQVGPRLRNRLRARRGLTFWRGSFSVLVGRTERWRRRR